MTRWRTLWLLLVGGMQAVVGPRTASAAETPCPDVFQYEGTSGNEYGIIIVPDPYPYLAIDITVQIYITAPVPSSSRTKLELVDKNVWRKLAAGARGPVLYQLDFPLPSPLPTIKSITVNQQVICRGQKPSASFLTTLTIQHAIYNDRCSSSSLECPYNIQQIPDTYQPMPPLLSPPESTVMNTASPTSPCPDVFKYEPDRSGDWHGIISVLNPYPVVAIDIRVELYFTATSLDRKGQLELVNNINEEWQRMRTGEQYFILYKLDFPVRSPLPTIKSITVNSQVICRGNKPSSFTVTTLSFQHALFNQKCPSSSLDCPDNIEQNMQTVRPRPPVNTPTPTREPPRPQPQPQPPPTRKPEPPKENPSVSTTTQCGSPVKKTNLLIFNGQDTTHGQWPWHAALYQHKGYDIVYNCGGSLVGTKTIITAAHCVTKNGNVLATRDFIVYLGRYDLRNRKEDGSQEKDVTRIFVHPSFNTVNYQADVAMLVLASTVQYTSNVRPVCLWNQGDTDLANIVGKEGVVVGWGKDENGNTAQKMKMVKMPVVNQETCIWSHATFFSQFTSNTTFCAGYRNGSSACNGDSGSGMVFPENQSDGTQIWMLRGIVSNSRPNDNDKELCDVNSYIVFTDIAQHLNWITALLI